MQGNTTIPPRKEVDLGDLNKGAELLLRDPKSKEKLQTKNGNKVWNKQLLHCQL